jgi:hypothetical protein
MNKVELIAQQLANSINVRNIWGDVIINVKESPYNAIGNGVKDDTVAIQKAVNYANSIGKHDIWMPPGTYKYTTISNTGNITFYGDYVNLVGVTFLEVVSFHSMVDRIDNIVAGAGSSNTEIVDARLPATGSSYPTLKTRLDTENANVNASIAAHEADTTAHNATAIVFTPAGSGISATNVDGAIKEQESRIDNLIIHGDSGPEAADARMSSPYGVTYPTLKDRVDHTDAELIAQKADFTTLSTSSIIYAALPPFNVSGNGSDQNANIQAAIDYAYDNGIKSVVLPKGTITISKPVYLWQETELVGANRTATILKKTANTTLADGTPYASVDALIILANRDKTTATYTLKQSIRHLKLTGASGVTVNYGVYALTAAPYLHMEDVEIRDGVNYGATLTGGTWMTNITDVFLGTVKRGIQILGPSSTSCRLNNVYVFGTTEIAYEFSSCTYSELTNCGADQCTGTVYSVNFGNLTFTSCGSESPLASQVLKMSNARATLIGCYFQANLTDSAAIHIQLQSSNDVKFIKCDFGTNTSSSSKAPGFFMSNGTVNFASFDESNNFGFFVLGEPSTNIQSHYKFGGKYGNVNTRESGSTPFLGWDRERYQNYVDNFLDTPKILGKALFLDNLGHPYYDNASNDRQFGSRGNKGDWYLINNPMKNGHAAYLVSYDTSIDHSSLGTITGVAGSVLTLSDITLDSFANDGTLWQTGQEVQSSSGGKSTNLTAVDYTAKTLTIGGTVTGTFNVGDTVKMPPRTFLNNCSFMVVPVIHSGPTSQRPTARRIIGQRYFDTDLGVELVWNGSIWKFTKVGTATMLSGGTSVVVTHGLGTTPACVTPTAQGNIGSTWVTAIGATTFTINCSAAPGSNTVVLWDAKI